MQEYVLNDLMVTLAGKIPDESLKTVKDAVTIWLKDYDVTKQVTALTVRPEDCCKELQAYIIAKKVEGKSDKTLKNYTRNLTSFIYYTGKPVKEVVKGDVLAYLHSKQMAGVKDVTVDNIRIVISSFYNWLVSEEYLDKNPCAHIGAIKHEKNVRHPLTAVEMEKLRGACKDKMEKAIIEILYSTGCRISELSHLKIEDIDLNTKEVHLFGKGKKHRTSYLNARAIVALNEYLQTRKGESEYVICENRAPFRPISPRSYQKRIKSLKERAGIESNVTPHIIRHTTATDAIDKGMPIEQVQKLLGHESIATTLIYAKVRSENVRQGHQKFIV